MKRNAYNDLISWKNSVKRKPLVLQGARQVGKTYLVKEFGKREYKNLYYLNFEQDPNLSNLFEPSLNPEIIINNISLYIGVKIIAEDTLLFFDEIQIAPRVLTSLKYFQEQAPDFHIIAAGSFLGVSIGNESSFPVGKVNFLTLYPMSFTEYLTEVGEDLFIESLGSLEIITPFPEGIHNKMLSHLKLYLFLGGMPEVINDYSQNKNIVSVRSIQTDILNAYEKDFSKYTDKNQAIKTSDFWNSIPNQLARENKKFKYKDIKKTARSIMYEQTIEWLRKAGLVHLAYNVETPKIPLSGYADFSKFKVYMHDVGLLAAKLNISSDQIVMPDALFRDFNGAFIENFIAQELASTGKNQLFYWTSRSDAEIDFLLESNQNIFPLEVKSGTSRNTKSLQSYASKNNPDKIFRTSPRNLIQSGNFVNIPLYAIELLKRLV
ncbi:MAG: ATP-binding protein [Bacteroidales bacterium]|nr:ATP-binding protein [Bacteroidales bacterium]MCF8405369.1 ATP-binding protein [Bacteroidales bacterium]